MKGYIVLFVMALLFHQLVYADDEPKHCPLNVHGMTCGGCVSKVKNAVSKLEGVQSGYMSYATRTEVLEHAYQSAKRKLPLLREKVPSR